MEFILTAVVAALLMMAFFFAGIYTANRLAEQARQDADYQYRKMIAYRQAGVERPGDPLPYVAPPITRRRRKIPHMDEIGRRLKEGGRGTVKITNEDT